MAFNLEILGSVCTVNYFSFLKFLFCLSSGKPQFLICLSCSLSFAEFLPFWHLRPPLLSAMWYNLKDHALCSLLLSLDTNTWPWGFRMMSYLFINSIQVFSRQTRLHSPHAVLSNWVQFPVTIILQLTQPSELPQVMSLNISILKMSSQDSLPY